MNFYSLPDDIIYIIINKINSYNIISNLKQSCHIFNNIISKKNIIKIKLEEKLKLENKKHRKLCINHNCHNLYLLKNVKLINSIILYDAYSINNTYIYINDKQCNIYSSYCQSCFIENVLIGDKKNNYSNMSCDSFIDFYYIPEY
jgi:hypothetical protein